MAKINYALFNALSPTGDRKAELPDEYIICFKCGKCAMPFDFIDGKCPNCKWWNSGAKRRNIFYSTTDPIFHDDDIYIHIPEIGIDIKIGIPLGHSIDDFDLSYSDHNGSGRIPIKEGKPEVPACWKNGGKCD